VQDRDAAITLHDHRDHPQTQCLGLRLRLRIQEDVPG
jgi:hypothetical protein